MSSFDHSRLQVVVVTWGLKYIFVTYSIAGPPTSVANGNSMGNVTDETINGIWTTGSTSAPTRNSMVNRSSYWPQVVTDAHTHTSNSLCPFNTSSSFSIQIVQWVVSFFGPTQEITMFYAFWYCRLAFFRFDLNVACMTIMKSFETTLFINAFSGNKRRVIIISLCETKLKNYLHPS